MTAETPKRGGCFGRSIVTVVIVLIVACVVCGIGAFVIAGPAITNLVNAVAAPITANNDFVNALIAKDYTKAYGMIHPSQQAAFGGSADGLKQLVADKGWDLSSYTFANVQIGTDALVNGSGTVANASGPKYVYVSLRKDGDVWKVIGLDINDNAPTATPPSGS